jgi:chemotaxis protein MotB
MSIKKLLFMLLVPFLVFAISGCVVSAKKYKKLEADYEALKKGYNEATIQLDEKDKQIKEFEEVMEEQKVVSEREISMVKKTNDELVANLKKEIATGKIQIEQIRGRLTMSIAEELFFESGKAEIKPEGQEVLKRIGNILKKIPEKNVRVEGHTDNVPIGPKIRERYPTNWELGATRAVNVVRFFQEGVGMDPLRLSAVSYGQYRPRATNRTEAGKAKNRRIEIILIDRDLDLAKKMRENLAVK